MTQFLANGSEDTGGAVSPHPPDLDDMSDQRRNTERHGDGQGEQKTESQLAQRGEPDEIRLQQDVPAPPPAFPAIPRNFT